MEVQVRVFLTLKTNQDEERVSRIGAESPTLMIHIRNPHYPEVGFSLFPSVYKRKLLYSILKYSKTSSFQILTDLSPKNLYPRRGTAGTFSIRSWKRFREVWKKGRRRELFVPLPGSELRSSRFRLAILPTGVFQLTVIHFIQNRILRK
jgi:hypothetical protein